MHLDQYEKDEWERQCCGPAQICAALANIYRDPKKRKKPYTVSDFMPSTGIKKKKKQTAEEMLAFVKMLNAAHGGSVV